MGLRESFQSPVIIALALIAFLIIALIILDVIMGKKIAQSICLIVAGRLQQPVLGPGLGISPLSNICRTLLPF